MPSRHELRDQDRYFAESGEIARLLDADPVPRTRAEAERLIGDSGTSCAPTSARAHFATWC